MAATAEVVRYSAQFVKDYWLFVRFGHFYPNRSELLRLLGGIEPQRIEPVLSSRLWPKGYGVQLMDGAQYDQVRNSIAIEKETRKNLSFMEKEGFIFARDVGIGGHTLRSMQVRMKPGMEIFRRHFEGFNVRIVETREVSQSFAGTKDYLIHFNSPEEAKLANLMRPMLRNRGGLITFLQYHD